MNRATPSVGKAGSDGNSINGGKAHAAGAGKNRAEWAPLIVYLGPCFAQKKVLFGCPMEHICFRESTELYEQVPLDTAVQIWDDTAHEGTLKALKQKLVKGTSVLERLRSEKCDEQALLCLYFGQLITKNQLKERLAQVIRNEALRKTFLDAVWQQKVGKSGLQVPRTVQLFVPEANGALSSILSKKIKWAIKYNPEIISLDEGNLTRSAYDIEQTIRYAHKYGRKVRIARWGQEIPDVPLTDLISEGLVSFLQTGRYVDCATIAASYWYAEQRRVNALGAVTSQEDFVFDTGYVLDKDGFVSTFHRPHTAVVPDVQKFSLFGLFRGSNQQNNAAKKAPAVAPASKRRSTLLTLISSLVSAKDNNTQPEIDPEHEIIERQIQRELGIHQQAAPAEVLVNAKSYPEMAELSAAAARNAHTKRQETNWVEFLNHKSVSIATTITVSSASHHHGISTRGAVRRGSFASTASKQSNQSKASKSSATRSDKLLHNTSSNSLGGGGAADCVPNSPARPSGAAELGSYSYGLKNKAHLNVGKSSSSDASADCNAAINVARSTSSLSTGSNNNNAAMMNSPGWASQKSSKGAPSAAQRALSSEFDDHQDGQGQPQSPPPVPVASSMFGKLAATMSSKENNQLPPRPQQRAVLTVTVPRGSQKASTTRTGGSTVGVDAVTAAFGANKAAKVKREMLILTTAVAATSPIPQSLLRVSFEAPDESEAQSSAAAAQEPSTAQEVVPSAAETAEQDVPHRNGSAAAALAEEHVVFVDAEVSPRSPSELSPAPQAPADRVLAVSFEDQKGQVDTPAGEVENIAVSVPQPAASAAPVAPSVRFQVPPGPAKLVPKQNVYIPTVNEVAKLKAYEQRLKATESKLKLKEETVTAMKTSYQASEELRKQEVSAEMASVKAKALAIENRVKSRQDLLKKDSNYNMSDMSAKR